MKTGKCSLTRKALTPENCDRCNHELKNGFYCKEIRDMMWLNIKANNNRRWTVRW